MIKVKKEFTAGMFDLPYVEIYSNKTNYLKNIITNQIITSTYNEPLIIEKYKLAQFEEYFKQY